MPPAQPKRAGLEVLVLDHAHQNGDAICEKQHCVSVTHPQNGHTSLADATLTLAGSIAHVSVRFASQDCTLLEVYLHAQLHQRNAKWHSQVGNKTEWGGKGASQLT